MQTLLELWCSAGAAPCGACLGLCRLTAITEAVLPGQMFAALHTIEFTLCQGDTVKIRSLPFDLP